MTRAGVQDHLESLARSSLASLRVVGLAYAGLGGMLALGLVISVAFMPVAPALDQVTQPARQMATGLVPATDAVVNLIGGPGLTRMPIRLFVPPPVSAAAAPPESDVADSAAADAIADEEQLATESSPTVQARPYVGGPLASAVAPVAADQSLPDEEELLVEPEPRPVVDEPAPVEQPVVLPAERKVLQAANEAPAKPLPALPRQTDTALQLKARVDAENQAAIDAAKAAQVRAKLEADVANQAAIDSRQGTEAAATATARNSQTASAMATSVSAGSVSVASSTAAATSDAAPLAAPRATEPGVALPSPPPSPLTLSAGPQTRAVADAANQAVIDANKSAQARARAQSNEANQSAIDTSKAARSAVKVTPVPPVPPVPPAPPTAQPALLPTSTPASTAIATELPTSPGPVVEMQVPISEEADDVSTSEDAPPAAGSDQA